MLSDRSDKRVLQHGGGDIGGFDREQALGNQRLGFLAQSLNAYALLAQCSLCPLHIGRFQFTLSRLALGVYADPQEYACFIFLSFCHSWKVSTFRRFSFGMRFGVQKSENHE